MILIRTIFVSCIFDWGYIGIYLGYIRGIFGIYLGYIWDMFGVCLGYVWDMFGVCLGYIWDIFGVYCLRISAISLIITFSLYPYSPRDSLRY